MSTINNRILLVSPPAPFLEEPNYVPHLGLLYISAALKSIGSNSRSSPEVKYIELAGMQLDDSTSGLISMIDGWKPGIVGFTSTTPQFECVKLLALAVKEKYPSIKIIIGGAHATNYTSAVRSSNVFDHIFIGEAEEEIIKFWKHYLTDCSTPTYQGQYTRLKRSLIPDWEVNGLDLDLYSCSIEGKKALPLLTSRGCKYSCAFCEKQPKGIRRERDIKDIRSELELFYKMDINAVVIYDCCLVVNRARALQLKELFTDFNLSTNVKVIWRAFLRADIANDDILNILHEAGCVEIAFGIESGSDTILQNINKNPCNRSINTNAIHVCRRHGIKSKAFLMVGLPGESKKTIGETIDWVLEAEPDQIDVSLYMPYKGSDITENPSKYRIKLHSENIDFSKMFYKGEDQIEISSVISIPTRGFSKGLTSSDVCEQFKRMRDFKKKYNDLAATIYKTQEKRNNLESFESYKILCKMVMHEGDLIWRQLNLFISTNSFLVIALGLFFRFATPLPLFLSVGLLGILGCIVWYRIYKKSWYNQKIWFFLARKQEVLFRFDHIFSEGAIIRQGTRVNDFTESNWRLGYFDKLPITTWMSLWIFGFLVFWIFISISVFFFPEIFKGNPESSLLKLLPFK